VGRVEGEEEEENEVGLIWREGACLSFTSGGGRAENAKRLSEAQKRNEAM
jgi:hypothetical protein